MEQHPTSLFPLAFSLSEETLLPFWPGNFRYFFLLSFPFLSVLFSPFSFRFQRSTTTLISPIIRVDRGNDDSRSASTTTHDFFCYYSVTALLRAAVFFSAACSCLTYYLLLPLHLQPALVAGKPNCSGKLAITFPKEDPEPVYYFHYFILFFMLNSLLDSTTIFCLL